MASVNEPCSVCLHVSQNTVLTGTIPARSSKTLGVPSHLSYVVLAFDDVCSIRGLPHEGDLVIAIGTGTLNGLILTPFSRLHHVDLPSRLMNLDLLLPRSQTPKFDTKLTLNRTLSTAVPSPTSTPKRQSSCGDSSASARAACVIASSIRSWRFSSEYVVVRRVKFSANFRPLEATKRGRFGECLVLVGDKLISVGYLDVDWQSSRSCAYQLMDDDENLPILKREIYDQMLLASRDLIGSGADSSRSEILDSVGRSQSDIAILLAGAILLNDALDRDVVNEFDPLQGSCMVLA
jgi:hypothetical protein